MKKTMTAAFSAPEQARQAAQLTKSHFSARQVRLLRARRTLNEAHCTMPIPGALGGGLSTGALYTPGTLWPSREEELLVQARLPARRQSEWREKMKRLGGTPR